MTRIGSWLGNRYREWLLERERLGHIWDPDDKWDVLEGQVVALDGECLCVKTKYDGVKKVMRSDSLMRLFSCVDIGNAVTIEYKGERRDGLLGAKNFSWNAVSPSGASIEGRSRAPICGGVRAPDGLKLGAASGISGGVCRNFKRFLRAAAPA